MRRADSGSFGARMAWGAALVLPILLGAGPGRKLAKPQDEPRPKIDETIGDLAFVRVDTNVRVQGVGLVIGLNGTGSAAEPSAYRSQLLDRMRKAQVSDAEAWLDSPNASLVLVKGTIPVGITIKDTFDIDLELTPASTTTSLAGGHLLLTELKIVQYVDGQWRDGQVLAEAYGPVMTGSLERPDDPRLGRVLGGARVRRDLPYQLILKPERQGFRTVSLVQNAISTRFFAQKGIDQKGMAEAKRPDLIVLDVPRTYHHNQFRYFQVIRRLPLVDNPALRAQRQARWARELLDPATAGRAALDLEGIGRNAIGALKEGLASPSPQVRFFAAEALAYLNDSSGADELAKAVVERPEFRAFALAALAAMDQPASILRLRELLGQADPKVRYGAFNALRTLDEHDPFLGRVRVIEDEEPAPGGDDTPAEQPRAAPRRRAPKPDDPFALYLVESDGPPMIHVSRNRRCEIVVFGPNQQLLTPIVLGGAGPILLNASLDDAKVQISRVGANDPGRADVTIESERRLGAVIRELANLGATYPEVLAILRAAQAQRNLQGPLVEDAVPEPTAGYDRAQLAGVAPRPESDPAVGRAALRTGATGPAPTPADRPARPAFLGRLRHRLRDPRPRAAASTTPAPTSAGP